LISTHATINITIIRVSTIEKFYVDVGVALTLLLTGSVTGFAVEDADAELLLPPPPPEAF
jgi:hypothetical protein